MESLFAGSADYVFKLIIIGDTNVGKSCLLQQFIDRRVRSPARHTAGVEFGSRIVTLADKTIKLQIWDTAGQERYKSVTKSYYRGAKGAIVVFDLSNRESFERVEAWITAAQALCTDEPVIVIVGNKADRRDAREVTDLEGSTLAQKFRAFYLETCALTSDNVEPVFFRCARAIMTKVQDEEELVSAAVGGRSKTGSGAGAGTSSFCPIPNPCASCFS